MTPAQFFIKQLQRPWWWSPSPPWAYHYGGDKSRGWHNVEPGVFNLMWASTAIKGTDVRPYAAQAWWPLVDGDKVRLSGFSLAEHAMTLTLAEFDMLLNHNRRELAAVEFPSGAMTGDMLLTLVGKRRRTCA